MLVVVSRNNVSCGAILRNTTFDIEDFPLLYESTIDIDLNQNGLRGTVLGP